MGAGVWGKNLVRNFAALPGADLRWVCDLALPSRGSGARASAPHARWTTDFGDVLSDTSVDAVVVSTQACSHAQLARLALEAGKDVFVEKPFTLDAREAAELCRLADRTRRVVMVGHLLLYHPAIVALRALIAAGALGDLRAIDARRLNVAAPGRGRGDESVWWALAPHDIALANDLFDDEPRHVTARGSEGRDVVFATFHYPRGRVARVHVSGVGPRKTRRLVVTGSRATAIFDDTVDDKLVLVDAGGARRVVVHGGEEPLAVECGAFIEAVRARAQPRSHGPSGLSTVRALEAGVASLAADGAPTALRAARLSPSAPPAPLVASAPPFAFPPGSRPGSRPGSPP